MDTRKPSILVTGSTGILGRILCRQLAKLGNVHELDGDITEIESIAPSIPDELDIVVHLAAMVPVAAVNENPVRAFEVNVGGTINLIKLLSALKKRPFLFYASTSHVYASSDNPLDEKSPIEPSTLYGATKHMAETIITATYHENFCIGRIFSFYHDEQPETFLYPAIRKRLAEEDLNKPFILSGANSIRDFLPAEKVCEYICQLSAKRCSGIFNIASGRPLTVSEFTQQFAPKELTIVNQGSSNSLTANIDKLKAAL